MFNNVQELMLFYSNLYAISFNFIETTPKYMFLSHNRNLFKRYKKDFKELQKFEKLEKRALNNYWKAKEKNNIEKQKNWLNKIKFLKDKRNKIVYKVQNLEEKLKIRYENLLKQIELEKLKQQLESLKTTKKVVNDYND